jgi:8-oxo-dGTP pyrophosphatase MutT (NUDIX family)
MVTRHGRGFFGGLVVFPGGGVDEFDEGHLARAVVEGSNDDQDHRAAALRELAEETGLLATDRGLVESPLVKGKALYESLSSDGLKLAGDSLVLVSRWITPESAPRRFDTRFYLLVAETAPEIRIDPNELVDHDWVTPREGLARYQDGEWPMFSPTVAHLRWLARHRTIEEAVNSATGADGRSVVAPIRAEDGSILPVLLPAEPQ